MHQNCTAEMTMMKLVLCILTLLTLTKAEPLDPYKYAVVIDAGSSGTRIWVYKWEPVYPGLPKFEYVFRKKTKIRMDESAKDAQKLRETVDKVISLAADHVPLSKQRSTPVYLLATAGMRELLDERAGEVMEMIQDMFKDTTINPFHHEHHSNIRILSGEEEAAFSWIAVNFMKGAFDPTIHKPAYKRTYGVLEMGGQSTQIAFVPKWPILSNLFPLKINGKKYSLYAHSYLRLGQDSIESRINDYLIDHGNNEETLRNPCFNNGTDQAYNDFRVLGAANNNKCIHLLESLVPRHSPRFCHPKPCGLGYIYQPSISPSQKFYALSVYPIIFRDLNITSPELPGPVTIVDLKNASSSYCEKNSNDMKEYVAEKRHKYLYQPCYMGHFMAYLLQKGYGFPADTKSIYSLEKINEKYVDWTLGALIYETTTSNHFHQPHHPPSTGFSTGAASRFSSPSSAIFLLSIALPLYKLFPVPVAMIMR